MNKYLKEVAKLCGIQKNLSMHIARHSFATYCLTLGVPLESVSKMLGHRSIKTTQIYAKVIDQKVSDDMSVMMIKAPRLESKIVQKTIVKSC
jgi:site-specific recombinase XerD